MSGRDATAFPSAGRGSCSSTSAAPFLTPEELTEIAQCLIFAARPLKAATDKVTAKYGLGTRGAWFLLLIDRGLVTNPSDVEKHFHIVRSLITAELGRLTKARLITYRKDTADRRRVRLALTRTGTSATLAIRKDLAKVITAGFARYPRAEVLKLSNILLEFSCVEVKAVRTQ
jgi:DNA-binding MarR family transcriptional regulator